MAATDFHIPEKHRLAFLALLSYDADRLDALVATLEKASPTLFLRSIAQQVADRASIPPDEALQILRALTGLFSFKEHFEIPETELPGEILAALEADPQIDVPETKKDLLGGFLAKVLTLTHTLGVTAKALSVASDFEHTYCSSRILTDMRPVFVPDTEDPAALVVIHNLKIAYHEGQDIREFFISLSEKELRELRNVVERAIRKESTLKSYARNTGLYLLEEDE